MKLPRRNFLHLAVGAAALPAVSRFAWAQAYPTRPVRLIVGWPPRCPRRSCSRPMNHPTMNTAPAKRRHAYADEQIGEKDSGAALDAHRPSVGRIALPVHPLRCFHNGGQSELDWPSSLGFYSPMVRVRPRLSGFIEPCLPSSAPNPPAGDGWIHEIKLDGFRMLAT
jgi:hypothetical protein